MLKLRTSILLCLCFAVPAHAGLFDDDALKKAQQVEVRVLNLEKNNQQQTQSIIDLQGQIDVLKSEIRKLRGENEELAHGLQDAEKREKDFYVDLDTRLRHLESIAADALAAPKPVDATVVGAVAGDAAAVVDPDDPSAANRAIEASYGLYKAGKNADAVKSFYKFLNAFPDSVHVPNARYWLGNAQFALKDYKSALKTFQGLLTTEPDSLRAPDVMFNIAGCQQELKAVKTAKITLTKLIDKYPDSAAAAKAKKLLVNIK